MAMVLWWLWCYGDYGDYGDYGYGAMVPSQHTYLQREQWPPFQGGSRWQYLDIAAIDLWSTHNQAGMNNSQH